MNTQMQTQIIERLNRIDLRLTALELCANSILRVVTTLAAATDKLEAMADSITAKSDSINAKTNSIEAKADEINRRAKKLLHETRGHRHFTEEQIERCQRYWELGKNKFEVKANCHGKVTHRAVYDYFVRDLRTIGIDSSAQFAAALTARSKRISYHSISLHPHRSPQAPLPSQHQPPPSPLTPSTSPITASASTLTTRSKLLSHHQAHLPSPSTSPTTNRISYYSVTK